jgi:tetratricopeptide (TPR) repeat protein
LGSVAHLLGEYDKAQSFYLESRALYQERGSRQGEAGLLNNLGETARLQGDYQAARQYYREALDISKEIDSKVTMVSIINNLGHVASAMCDYAAALPCYQEALQIAMNSLAIPRVLESLAGWAGVLASTGQPQRALELLGLALGHPALDDDTKSIVMQVLAELRVQLPPEEIEQGLKRGQALHLESVAAELLAQASETPDGVVSSGDCAGTPIKPGLWRAPSAR